MAPSHAQRSGHRDSILSEIKNYQNIENRITVPLEGVETLFAGVSSYLEGESENDDFGDVEDDDLLFVESTNLTTSTTGRKRTTPSDFDDGLDIKKLKPNDDARSAALAERILQKTWNFPHFRLQQQQAITRLINGGNAVVVFPTGGGKSLVYQIPALAFDEYDQLCGKNAGGGITLVVSPLIALMKVSHN